MNFKENVVFELLKDVPIKSSKALKRELIEDYHLEDRNASNVIVKIKNYQIKKYGNDLSFGDAIIVETAEVMNQRDRARKQDKIRRYGLKNRNSKEARWRE